MTRILAILFALVPALASAEGFQRPIPSPQTATAETSFALASLALVLSLIFVRWLVARR